LASLKEVGIKNSNVLKRKIGTELNIAIIFYCDNSYRLKTGLREC